MNLGPDLPGPRPVRPGDRRVRGGPRPVAQADRGPDPAGRGPLGQEPDARPPRRQGQGRRRGAAGDRPARQDRSKARQAAGAGPTDAGLIGNAADLAVALTETGKADRGPGAARPDRQGPDHARRAAPSARLMEATLLAQINAGQVEPAIATMKALEQIGQRRRPRPALLQARQAARNASSIACASRKDTASLKQMQQAYRTFLTALTESKAGQTYESLQWAGESLLSLDAGAEAENVLRRVLDEAISNPAFLNQAGGKERVLRTKLKLAAALRSQGTRTARSSTRPSSLVEELLCRSTRATSSRCREGHAPGSPGRGRQGEWSAAFGHWQDLAQKLSRMPAPARWLVLRRLVSRGLCAFTSRTEDQKARQTLNGVMRLESGRRQPGDEGEV